MLRSEIIDAANHLAAALEFAGIDKVFAVYKNRVRDIGRVSGETRAKQPDPESILIAFQKYQHEYSRFSAAERNLVALFNLGFLSEPRWWTAVVTFQLPPPELFQRESAVRFAQEFVPKIVHMLDREVPVRKSGAGEETHQQIFTVLLAEEPNNLSSPERIILMLSGVQKLYEACARLAKETENSISVARCDSGSEKTFDFLGLAKIFEEVRSVINDMWDRVIFFRENKIDRRLDLVLKSMPILDKIG